MKSLILMSLLLAPNTEQQDLNHVWAVSVGFGEIPFLAGSFKPSVSIGYHINQFIYFGTMIQLRDIIERGDESYNATGADIEGLVSTKEYTGVRVFLGARLRPYRYLPYLALGAVFNGSDSEQMVFDARSRQFDNSGYDEALIVEVSRPFGIRPAVGLGYSLTLDNRITFNIDFTGAWLFDVPKPDIIVQSSGRLTETQRHEIKSRFKKAYDDNFHNKYHIFNISAGYVW